MWTILVAIQKGSNVEVRGSFSSGTRDAVLFHVEGELVAFTPQSVSVKRAGSIWTYDAKKNLIAQTRA